MDTAIVKQDTALLDLGSLSRTAEEIFAFTCDTLIQRGTPIKAQSLALHAQYSLLPADWMLWTEEQCTVASALYDEMGKHEKTVTGKGTELDNFRDKAEKFKKGILRAYDDILSDIPSDKEVLMFSIRRWRNREEEKARIEADRLLAIARKQEEEARLAEALRLEEEAERLKSISPEIAAEVKAEAEKLIEEPAPFIPPPIVKAEIPKGGPKKQKFWKYTVVDFKVLPDAFKIANDQMIGATVRAQKGATKIPGVKVWEE